MISLVEAPLNHLITGGGLPSALHASVTSLFSRTYNGEEDVPISLGSSVKSMKFYDINNILPRV